MFPEPRLRQVKEVFALDKGPFYGLTATLPEQKEDLDGLFYEYYMVRPVSPIVEDLRSKYSDDTQFFQQLARYLWNRYHRKWEKLFGIDELEYVPIDNYSDTFSETLSGAESEQEDITRDGTTGNARVSAKSDSSATALSQLKSLAESETKDESTSRSGTESEGKSSTTSITGSSSDTRTDDLTQSNAGSTSSDNATETDTGVYAENTNELSPTDKEEVSSQTTVGNASVQVNTGTQSHSGSTSSSTTEGEATAKAHEDETLSQLSKGRALAQADTTDTNQTSDSTTSTAESGNTHGEDSTSRARANVQAKASTHTGILGNTSRQKLIRQEIELWNWTIVQEMLNDAKDFCCLPIWE